MQLTKELPIICHELLCRKLCDDNQANPLIARCSNNETTANAGKPTKSVTAGQLERECVS